jgi:hypothetical protein
MRRGDIVTVAAPGAYGKPRPAVVIQGDSLNQREAGVGPRQAIEFQRFRLRVTGVFRA